MPDEVLVFTAAGSPQIVSREIEQFAARQGSLNAIVVPWESDGITFSMSVTFAKAEGWAIEHTSLGTIRLTDLGNGLTRVEIAPHQPDNPDKQKLAVLFDGFASRMQSKFQVAP